MDCPKCRKPGLIRGKTTTAPDGTERTALSCRGCGGEFEGMKIPYTAMTGGSLSRMSPKQLVEILSQSGLNVPFPLAEKISQTPDCIPYLLLLLGDPDLWHISWAPIHALHLVAAMEAREALPLIIGRMRADPDCFGDWLTETLPSILYCMAEVGTLLEFLQERQAYMFARTACSQALAAMAFANRSLVARLAPSFRAVLEDASEDEEFLSWFAEDAASLQDPEVMKLLEQLWEQGRIDRGVVGLKTLRRRFESGRPAELDRVTLDPMAHFSPENLDHLRKVEEQEHARRQQPIRSREIGRNEPCPCGSGKKYKKCCLRV